MEGAHLLLLSLFPVIMTFSAITGITLDLWSADAAALLQLYLYVCISVTCPLSTWWFCFKVGLCDAEAVLEGGRSLNPQFQPSVAIFDPGSKTTPRQTALAGFWARLCLYIVVLATCRARSELCTCFFDICCC